MDDKYIELLINRCTTLKKTPILFISYNKEIQPFIDKLIEKVKSIGVSDIYLECNDRQKIHDALKDMTYEEIDNSPYFNKRIWDEYASKGASFLMFETEIPHLMDDIDPQKIGYASKVQRSTKPIYRRLQEKCELSWCIAAYPGEKWAKDIYGDNEEAYDKLKNAIYKMCMIDKENPIKEWDNLLEKNKLIIDNLNSLNLAKLHYENSLGTNLDIYLPDNYLYSSAKDNDIIVNLPSYEVFTSPIYNKTNGIVYSSKPLSYNGVLINNFWIKFKDGKVIEYDAEVGKEVLGEIINTDDKSCYLGEAALVEVGSPIDSMNTNFGTTLIDENASCHLALGAGFNECLKGGLKMEEDELLKHGINTSKQHVDFMIGTKDLNITGYTKDNKTISIFKNGRFNEEVLNANKN
ncbi:MAG: aminopeptidase [Bacilli bacterium]|nr:aminopeptidase [Bacilli bacterium]